MSLARSHELLISRKLKSFSSETFRTLIFPPSKFFDILFIFVKFLLTIYLTKIKLLNFYPNRFWIPDTKNILIGDICIIVVDGFFEYQPHIAPACVDFDGIFQKYPTPGTMALVASWGVFKVCHFKELFENLENSYFYPKNISSEFLVSYEIPTVDFQSCRNMAPKDFKPFVIYDKVGQAYFQFHKIKIKFLLFLKVCAGYAKSEESFSKVICPGDQGGGLLIPQTKDNQKRYYLQGVMSSSHLECDTTFYALFTNLQEYTSFKKFNDPRVVKQKTIV